MINAKLILDCINSVLCTWRPYSFVSKPFCW